MAASRYEKWLESFGLEYIRRLSEEGLPEQEIAIRSSLDMPTFCRWKKKYPDFAAALRLGAQEADFSVIKALYKKATGYNVLLNKTYKLKRVDYDPQTGKKLREYEELATGVDESHIPSDLRAETFWLKSRQPERWCESADRSRLDSDEVSGVVELPEADMIDSDNVDKDE